MGKLESECKNTRVWYEESRFGAVFGDMYFCIRTKNIDRDVNPSGYEV